MVITLAAWVAQASQSGAPNPFINDFLVSDYYDVSVVNGWSVPSAPTQLTILLWRKLDGKNTIAKQITLIGTNELGETVDVPTGQSVTVRIPGHCAYVGATVVMTGGSTPTFTGTVIADGNFSDSSAF